MKILLLDIETSPHEVYTFDLYNAFISNDKIITPSSTLCWSAKWLGEDEIMYDSVYQSSFKQMVKGIYKLMNEADAIVHYNGKHFDIPTLNREFILEGLPPPKPAVDIDLLPVVRKRFKFPSNKLAYVVKALGIGEKIDVGFDLWKSCLNNDPSSWELMEAYNKNDILLLESLYEVVRGWIKNHPNVGLYSGAVAPSCTNCGSLNVRPRGYRYTKTRKYRQYRCKDCGATPRSRLSEKPGPDKGVLAGT